MTVVEWLHDKWSNCKEWQWQEIEQWFEQAKEMEKQQKIQFGYRCISEVDAVEGEVVYIKSPEEVYILTYGSKGSDAQRIYGEHTITMLEISDEEIEKVAENTYVKYNAYAIEGFIEGAKWYREQLKKK